MEQTLDTTDNWLVECLDSSTIQQIGETKDAKPHIRTKDEQKENKRTASRRHSTPLTLEWLEENYEMAEGVCIPRNLLYLHYIDYCYMNDTQPVNAASFGKIIRQQFQHITTRRLGTRGQSKYHYYGIGVKETSKYYEVQYSKNGIQNQAEGKKDTVKQIIAYSPRTKLGTLLPEFPSMRDMKLPPGVAEEKVTTFLMMYRTHCQRILDTVIRANFDEVQSFLLHFWQGMPAHIVPILELPVIINLVGVCDCILYKAISGVLMPSVLQALPDSLTQVIRKFAKQFDDWLKVALDELPESLRIMKFDLSRRFGQLLRRQASLNHLCQASRSVIHSADILGQMLEDWAHVDLASICKQTLYTMDTYSIREHEMLISLYKEFESLLEDQAPIECYTEWLDSMIDRCVVQPAAKKIGSLRRRARQFLLMWSCFGTRVIRDMTLHSAASFGSFHLIHLMFDDYVLYQVEHLHSQERANELLRLIKGESVSDSSEELVLPNPAGVTWGYDCPSANSPSIQTNYNMDRQTVITDGREAYGLNSATGSFSPESTSQRASTSPSSSSMSLAYDNRLDGSMTSPSAAVLTSPNPRTHGNGSHVDSLQGESGYQYGRYMNGMTSHPVGSPQNQSEGGTASYTPSYGLPSVTNSQYYYGGREQQPDWTSTEQQRFAPSNTAALQAVNTPPYVIYPQRDYDGSYSSYDNGMYAGNQGHSSTATQHSAIYPHYSVENSSYYPPGGVAAIDSDSRKRKYDSQEGMRTSSAHKRLMTDYSYMSSGGYARA